MIYPIAKKVNISGAALSASNAERAKRRAVVVAELTRALPDASPEAVLVIGSALRDVRNRLSWRTLRACEIVLAQWRSTETAK